jgi:hypothetical protein
LNQFRGVVPSEFILESNCRSAKPNRVELQHASTLESFYKY